MTVQMVCLDDNAVLAYVERMLPEAQRREVAAHLDECEVCLTITCAAARSAGTTAIAVAVDPESAAAIGRYSLIEMIGRGAMGSVYIAHDPQLDRRVALKVVRDARFAEDEVRARLSREARAMARVTHPSVVRVYDAGELADGVFIAMELVDGDTLAQWLAVPRPWRDIVKLFIAVGRGLAAAHAAGIVHRDFKPENVLVDRLGHPAVTDFGLALAPATPREGALEDVTLATAHELTRTGVLLGTPRYMSAEQFRGGAIDARTDQFSFAVALYHALYGTHAFAGVTIGELRASVLAGKPHPRPAQTPVPVATHRVLERALATDPAARYPSIDALLDDLAATVRPKRRRVAIAIGGVAIAAIVGGVAITRTASPAATAATKVAAAPTDGVRTRVLVERFANHTSERELDDTLDLVVGSLLYHSTRIDPAAGTSFVALAAQLEGAPTSGDAIAAQLRANSPQPVRVIHGSIAAAGTGYVISLETEAFTASEPAASQADVVAATARVAARLLAAMGDPAATELADHRPSLQALHAFAEGQQLAYGNEQAKAVEAYRRALAADPDFDEARASLGLTLYNLSERPAAVAELERAFAHADRMPERQRLTLLGDYYSALGNYADAITAYQQLLVRWPADGRTEVNITATAIDEGSWPLALDLARRAAKDHPNLGIVRGNLVLAELANGRFDEAVRDGVAMIAEIPRPPSFATVAVALAEALSDRGADARGSYDALETREPELADESRADLAIYEGRLDDGEALLRKWVDPALARGKPDDASSEVVTLARLLLRRGDRPGAGRLAKLEVHDGSPRRAYIAASTAAAAGATDALAELVRTWGENPEPEWRTYSKLLAGDLAQKPADAVAAYQEANRIGASWLTHARLGRGYLKAARPPEAERELQWCIDHRGEGAVFMTPTLSYLPEVLLDLARAKQDRAAYQAVIRIAPEAQHDPLTDEARAQIAKLAP